MGERQAKGHQGEWEEVRRPNQRKADRNFSEVTTFFVSGFPNGINGAEMKKEFQGFGQVVDVFFSRRKDSNQRNFAFIRFAGLKNAKEMEKRLQGIKVRGRLVGINISRFQRVEIGERKSTLNDRRPHLHQQPHPPPPPPPMFNDENLQGRQQEGRSYARVVSEGRNASGTVLIGEAHSLNHISNLPEALSGRETKYLGGLRIAIEIGHAGKAKELMENRDRWSDWFKWLQPGDKTDLRYERIAWLKVLGLPLKLWDVDNFNTICSNFGKVIHPFDGISCRKDLSMGKVGVLSSARKWINEELLVAAEGKMYKIGVVEYTDDWNPFTPLPFDKNVESDDEDEDSEGVSDTWMEVSEEDESEKEEGECSPGENRGRKQRNLDNDPAGNGQPKMSPTGEVQPETSPIGDQCDAGGVGVEAVPPVVEIEAEDEQSALGIDNTVEINNINNNEGANSNCPNPNIHNPDPTQVMWSNNITGPVEALVPLGCFGPFRSNIPNGPMEQQLNSQLKSGVKRRRVCRLSPRTSPRNYSDNSFPPLSTPPIDPPSSNHLDLNKNPNPHPQQSCETTGDTHTHSSRSNELEATAEIGAEIGFQIESNNEVLVSIFGGDGEKTGNK
ncbi:hypothetical protein L1887_15229 [Cichorium endivia]|nr:hypothetical protein L1887_15229 [Cichorium endivia]